MARTFWAGFVDGKLHAVKFYGDAGVYGRVAVFTSRERAKLSYSDVRRVEVREVKRRRVGGRGE